MKNNIKLFDLVKSGLPVKTAVNLTESQISKLHEKLFSEQTGVRTEVKPTQITTIAQSALEKGVNVGGRTMKKDSSGNVVVTENGEMSEEKNNKDKQNPWKICHAKLGPKKNAKFERCVRDVKKSLDENNNSLTLSIENKIMELLETHLPPKITKKDLLKYLTESEPAPVKEPKQKPKPGTKNPPKPTKTPIFPGKNPNPKVNPGPMAKYNKEVSESPEVAPSKPETKPKPGTKNPPKPTKTPIHPGKNPNPKVNPGPMAKNIDPEEAKEKIIDTIMKMLRK